MLFGFLNCNKPVGMTSRDLVNLVQRRVRPAKVGHAGTLDPLAQGVLILGVGPAVRLVPYVQQMPKRYLATFRLGESSLSGDLEGPIESHPDLPAPMREQLVGAAASLTGTIRQTPPAHSAIWVDGKRAYKRVRAGEKVEMPSRTVRVDHFSIKRYQYPEVDLDIVCGSGTYIRTLGIDLAKACGTEGVMSFLQRTEIGGFTYENTVSIDQLKSDPIEELLVPAMEGVRHLPTVTVDPQDSVRLGLGQPIGGLEAARATAEETQPDVVLEPDQQMKGDTAAVTESGRLRAIVRRKRGTWWPHRVFPE